MTKPRKPTPTIWNRTVAVAFEIPILIIFTLGISFIFYYYGQFRGEEAMLTKTSALFLVFCAIFNFLIFHFRITELCKAHSASKIPATYIWLIISAGFIFLAADELWMFHEQLDLYIHHVFRLTKTSLTDRIDDVILLVYIIAGSFILYLFRVEVLGILKKDAAILYFGVLMAILHSALDILTNDAAIIALLAPEHYNVSAINDFLSLAEEYFKLTAEFAFVVAFYNVVETFWKDNWYR